MNSTYFPHFTIGSDAYDKIPDICGEYGKTAVIIGGTKAVSYTHLRAHET